MLLQVLDTREGSMRLFACLGLSTSSSSSTRWGQSFSSRPVLCMSRDGSRAVLGNAPDGRCWVLDVEGGSPAVELSGACAGELQKRQVPKMQKKARSR